MPFDELIDRLARRFRTGRPHADARGHVRFDLARGVSLELFLPAHDRVFVEAELRPLPGSPAEAEPVLREALSLSLGLVKDRPETLALDSVRNRLVLFREFALEPVEFGDLERDLAGLLDLVERLRGERSQRATPQPATMLIFP